MVISLVAFSLPKRDTETERDRTLWSIRSGTVLKCSSFFFTVKAQFWLLCLSVYLFFVLYVSLVRFESGNDGETGAKFWRCVSNKNNPSFWGSTSSRFTEPTGSGQRNRVLPPVAHRAKPSQIPTEAVFPALRDQALQSEERKPRRAAEERGGNVAPLWSGRRRPSANLPPCFDSHRQCSPSCPSLFSFCWSAILRGADTINTFWK